MYERRGFQAPGCRSEPPYAGNGSVPTKSHPIFYRAPCGQRRGEQNFSPHYRDRPPSSHSFQPNFIIQLMSHSSRGTMKEAETREIVKKLDFQPQRVDVSSSTILSVGLIYEQWSEALRTVVQLWDMKLNDSGLKFLPRIISHVGVPSDKVDLSGDLKFLFLEKLRGLMEGVLVRKWMKKFDDLERDIQKVSDVLRRRTKIGAYVELRKKKGGLEVEKDLIWRRVKEFKSGVNHIINYLEAGEKGEDDSTPIFQSSDEDIDWERIYWLMMRECQRFDGGLPIYAHRQNILKQINREQITVLIGETGSGKSTQLVQFLVDSDIFGGKSIICTQPRKLAALSLSERVKEECHGCYKDATVICCPSYASFQEFDSKVIFMTDHCLLQHYMSDKQLSMISCIIIDEAHERSLNTDLLLALIKKLLIERPDLRLVIMSATADANQFSEYFFGCRMFNVTGRTFPVDIKYASHESDTLSGFKSIPLYVSDVVRKVTQINNNEKDGTILAFLTSQMEVEWACENFQASSAIALPLHGKLSREEQHKVFLSYMGKRKVIFTTNVAETSLTIPGVKYVVDSGLAKESRFEPASGMNILRVCRISQSSAKQRAGRAGRTEPGTCYRLYTENDYDSMPHHQEPEIRMVHLGIAILRIFALGIKKLEEFEFVDAPSSDAIDVAVKSLIQLGAVVLRNGFLELTLQGENMVKLGIEPRLCKIILQCFHSRLGREGLVLAAVMANSSSIFCRVGTEDDKLKSDRKKVKFCHPDGDLFTFLAVYKEWEALPRERKNTWCWENSINSKSMRRCHDAVLELEAFLKNQLNIIIPSYWNWNPQINTKHNEILRNIILCSLAENAAMYSGYDQLGYQVASSGKHVQLHPSCSLLNFGQRPSWVVFGEILSVTNEYLVCVTACDFNCLSTFSPPPRYDFLAMDNKRLHKRILSGFGSVLLKKFCGKCNGNLRYVVSSIRASCGDERIGVEVNVEENQIILYATSRDMETVSDSVSKGLEYERKLLQNECLEKCLYNGGPRICSPIALFGYGAEIRHLELENRFLTVDVFHSHIHSLNDKELLMFLESFTSGHICAINRFSGGGHDNDEMEKWGKVTFLTPDAAMKAVDLKLFKFCGGSLRVIPSRNSGGDHKMVSFPAVRAKIFLPRRQSKGFAIVKCNPMDVTVIVKDFSNLIIGDRLVWCRESTKFPDSVVISGFDKELFETDLLDILKKSTNIKIMDFFLMRKFAEDKLSPLDCEDAILHQISAFMPRGLQERCVHVQVFSPDPKDSYMRAIITFNGTLHLEAAKALEEINGKILPGCSEWQKIRCQQLFHSSVSCPVPVYLVIRPQLDSLLARIRRRNGVECSMERNQNGSYRVKISANATKIVAELRSPLEQLMKGKILQHPDITPAVLQLLFSRDGADIMKSIQRETGTCILFDKLHITVRIFGSPINIDCAELRLAQGLLVLHERKLLEIQLRDGTLPPDMMKRVVQSYGPDLKGIKEKFPEGEFSLNTRRHCISITGTKDLRKKVEVLIYDLGQTTGLQNLRSSDDVCSICLCEVDDAYMFEGCYHEFCRICLVEQFESAIRSRDGFPLRCVKENCGAPILLTDLRSLLSSEKLEELFRASLGAFIVGNACTYRFCPSPGCPSVYRVSDPNTAGAQFVCGACGSETCTRCHVEYHPLLSCEEYQEYKVNPDTSFNVWRQGKEDVKECPHCGFTIEKDEGCSHMECRCGRHLCWKCLETFASSEECYNHLRSVHLTID